MNSDVPFGPSSSFTQLSPRFRVIVLLESHALTDAQSCSRSIAVQRYLRLVHPRHFASHTLQIDHLQLALHSTAVNSQEKRRGTACAKMMQHCKFGREIKKSAAFHWATLHRDPLPKPCLPATATIEIHSLTTRVFPYHMQFLIIL